MEENQTVQTIQKIKGLYEALLERYQEEAEQIDNID